MRVMLMLLLLLLLLLLLRLLLMALILMCVDQRHDPILVRTLGRRSK